MSMSEDSELGTLIIVVLKAKNLIDKHSFYKQDVFAKVVFNGTTKKTQVDVKGGQHPVWDSELRFPVMKAVTEKTRKLEVSCYAKESRSNGLLGKGTVDIAETLNTGEFDDWVSLNIDGVVRGEVYLEMTFFSSSPRPKAVSKPHPGYTSPIVPLGQDLIMRPSKLSSSERLYRPPQPSTPSALIPTKSDDLRSSASTGRPSISGSHSPLKTKDSPLPPLPETQWEQTTLPSVLHAGGTFQHIPQGNPPGSGLLPSTLSPGNANAYVPEPRSPDHAHHLSPSPSLRLSRQSSPSFGTSAYDLSPSSNQYFTQAAPAPSTSAMIPSTATDAFPSANYADDTRPITPAYALPIWDQTSAHTADFSFPIPMASNPQPDLPPYPSYRHHEAKMGVYPTPLLDPYLSARYTAPFPLPPSVTEPNFTSSPWQPEITPTPDRLEALKKAEDDAIQRREQEQMDLELALQLDKQLNT